MKNIFYITVLVLGFQSITAQEFQETNEYVVSVNGKTTKQQAVSTEATLQTDSETTIALTSFPMEATETMKSITVKELNRPGLEGVSKVLKIEMKYTEYCAYVVSQYILVTNNGDYIRLPKIGNTICNDSSSEVKYLFPSQKFGKPNQIVRSEVENTAANAVTEVTTQETFSWNDDDFGTAGAITENL